MDLDNLADLVFFQNGMLEPWLQSKGLSDADQVLAYFAVSKLGEAPIDGRTDTNPEGLTAAYGKWASAVAGRLYAGGLSCKVMVFSVFYLFLGLSSDDSLVFCFVILGCDKKISTLANFLNLINFVLFIKKILKST